MKIHEINGGQSIQRDPGVAREKTNIKPGHFQDLLNQELGSGVAGVQDGGRTLEGLKPLGAPSGLSTSWGASPAGDEGAGSGIVSRAFSLLDGGLGEIQRSLDEIRSSPKVVGEILGQLSREAESFQESAKGLPPDHPVKQVGDELSVLAYVESVKWNRGDYL